MERTEFLSQEHVSLQSIFIFPKLSSYTATGGEESVEKTIDNTQQLLRSKYTLIHGEEWSGKTALCRHLFLTLIDRDVPVLYIDIDTIGRKARPEVYRDAYQHEFHGDYSLWKKRDDKTIILDNLSCHAIDHVTLAINHFDRVIVALPTDTFRAYYRDDDRLAKFREIEILPLTHAKQEELIRKRIKLSGQDKPVLDGQIDEIENRVNAVIINNRILPRYPFYVLSILQTYEGFMPNDLSVTSYGHCYYVLIIAYFSKSGIADDEINACLNFAENLAFEIYRKGSDEHSKGRDLIDEFKKGYEKKFIPLKDSTFSRLFNPDYGIIKDTGHFRNPYMYYYFLGKYLANNSKRHKDIIEHMVARSYITSNCLTLIFTIHHTNDEQIIEEILIHTMCALDDIEPSTLERQETEIYEDIVKAIPSQILSRNSVQSEREKERDVRDSQEFDDPHEPEKTSDDESMGAVNDIYKIMKNNEILGQILRNKYGSLERDKVVEIIETIADGGLRLVRVLLADQEEINDTAVFVHKKYPKLDIDKVKQAIRIISFLWTMIHVEGIVGTLNKPEIRSLVEEVVAEKNTPAYDLIGYFLRLDTIEEFSENERRHLKKLMDKYRYEFFRRVISIRTQRYLNTHKVRTPEEQAVCSLLGIKYQPRLKMLG